MTPTDFPEHRLTDAERAHVDELGRLIQDGHPNSGRLEAVRDALIELAQRRDDVVEQPSTDELLARVRIATDHATAHVLTATEVELVDVHKLKDLVTAFVALGGPELDRGRTTVPAEEYAAQAAAAERATRELNAAREQDRRTRASLAELALLVDRFLDAVVDAVAADPTFPDKLREASAPAAAVVEELATLRGRG